MYLIIFDTDHIQQQDDFTCDNMDGDTYEAWCSGLLRVFRINSSTGQFEEMQHPDNKPKGEQGKEIWKAVKLYDPDDHS